MDAILRGCIEEEEKELTRGINVGMGKLCHRGPCHRQPICYTCCTHCRPKDKAMKKAIIQSIVVGTAIGGISEESVFDTCVLPELYVKLHYCVSCATHSKDQKPGASPPPHPHPALNTT
ncbi:unnamed protein product [Nyctereutes procyonoides]|uniref:40S ribosomal protein S26 n=1 Tax=Nyctereutes procyonoides TaxID=34880 RepID=A0A811ZBL4_NYCPR|nr:unnamed protein product [Nyctereutes procyonoides]